MVTNNRRSRVVVVALLAVTCALSLSARPVHGQGVDRDAAFERATAMHQSGDLEGAVRGYLAILKEQPKRVDVRSNLGAAYAKLGRYEEAIEQYKQALSYESGNKAIRFNLSLAYYKAALFAEAANELSQFLNAAPNAPQRENAIMVLADCNVRLGNYKKVIESLTPLAGANPNDRTVAYLLGSALIGDGQLSQGQTIIDRVFRDDDSAEARLLMGSILLLADDAQASLKELSRAIEINPKLPTLQAWYGRALMRLGDTEKAKDAFKVELAADPNNFDANLYLGVLLRQDKSPEEALTYLTRAITLRPREQYARYHLAAVYAAVGKPEEARPLLERVVKEYVDFVEARVLLASVYYRLNRREDGDREKSIIQKLNSETQAKQPGSQEKPNPAQPSKTPENLPNALKPNLRFQ
jgi:tetratricopeptide (TPR) repeat protein